MPPITRDQIERLRDWAAANNDPGLVAICINALAGDAEALAECERIITSAELH